MNLIKMSFLDKEDFFKLMHSSVYNKTIKKKLNAKLVNNSKKRQDK